MNKMKFIIHTTSQTGPRLGTLTNFKRIPDVKYETPTFMFYTKGGHTPHITKEVFTNITNESRMFQIPLMTTHQMVEVLTKYRGINVAEFCSIGEHVTCLSAQDYSAEVQEGHFEKDLIPLWTRTGKKMLSGDIYMDVMEAFKPDMYLSLSDGRTEVDDGRKRLMKSSERTTNMLAICCQRHLRSNWLRENSAIIGVVVGGSCRHAIDRCIDRLSAESATLSGYSIEGLHTGGSSYVQVSNAHRPNYKDTMQYILNNLPSEKPKFVFGCFNPSIVLEFIELGVDVFDSTYPYALGEVGVAMTFNMADTRQNGEQVEFALDLNDSNFKDDLTPICQSCQCLTCQNHTRAYVNHLLNTNELLSKVLLTIHNLKYFDEFFKIIRRHINTETFQEFKELILRQYEEYSMSIVQNQETPGNIYKKKRV